MQNQAAMTIGQLEENYNLTGRMVLATKVTKCPVRRSVLPNG